MAFQFSLAAVLRLREIEEQREERALMEILVELARTREKITALAAQGADAVRRREISLAASLPAAELNTLYARVQLAKKQREVAEEQLRSLEAHRATQTARYQAARQARELLTGMRDEQRTSFMATRARQEQKSLDDIFSSRWRGK